MRPRTWCRLIAGGVAILSYVIVTIGIGAVVWILTACELSGRSCSSYRLGIYVTPTVDLPAGTKLLPEHLTQEIGRLQTRPIPKGGPPTGLDAGNGRTTTVTSVERAVGRYLTRDAKRGASLFAVAVSQTPPSTPRPGHIAVPLSVKLAHGQTLRAGMNVGFMRASDGTRKGPFCVRTVIDPADKSGVRTVIVDIQQGHASELPVLLRETWVPLVEREPVAAGSASAQTRTDCWGVSP